MICKPPVSMYALFCILRFRQGKERRRIVLHAFNTTKELHGVIETLRVVNSKKQLREPVDELTG